MVNKSLMGATCTCLAVISFAASATTLESRLGGQAYYDPVANLTWLTDANAAGTLMNWADANTWAASLNVDGITGWRLPDTLQPDASCDTQTGGSYGFGCTGSEMGNLFYNSLGNTAGSLSNAGPFSNVQSGWYWSATAAAPFPGDAWWFSMAQGYQGSYSEGSTNYAWAVHSGDVGTVPIPAAAWLFGSGLIGLIGLVRRKKA